MKVSLQSQLGAASTIDAFLVLGGDIKKNTRTAHVYNLCKPREATRDVDLVNCKAYVILSGDYYGLTGTKQDLSQAQAMANYLKEWNFDMKRVIKEDRSVDTLTNAYFSAPHIHQVCSGSKTKRVGVITDSFHAERALWAVEKILGLKYDVFSFDTGVDNSTWFSRLVERQVLNAWQHDMRSIVEGDKEELKKYFLTTHAFTAKEPGRSRYKKGINLLRRIKGLSREQDNTTLYNYVLNTF